MAVVCPLTTSLHPNWAHRHQVVCASKPAEIMVDQIRAVSLVRFIKRIDTLSTADSEAIRNLIAMLYATP
jgi:mRNA interferase MazF